MDAKRKRGRPVSTRTCDEMENGKPCGGKHHGLGKCKRHYDMRRLCWCGRKIHRDKLCYGHWLRSLGILPKEVEIGQVNAHRRKELAAGAA